MTLILVAYDSLQPTEISRFCIIIAHQERPSRLPMKYKDVKQIGEQRNSARLGRVTVTTTCVCLRFRSVSKWKHANNSTALKTNAIATYRFPIIFASPARINLLRTGRQWTPYMAFLSSNMFNTKDFHLCADHYVIAYNWWCTTLSLIRASLCRLCQLAF